MGSSMDYEPVGRKILNLGKYILDAANKTLGVTCHHQEKKNK